MMLTCDEIVEEVARHPVYDRVSIIDSVLQGLMQADREIENARLDEAEKRLNAYREGRCGAFSLDQVMAKYGRTA